MRRATLRTVPASHSETCDTFRASEASALGTGLGSISLVNFDTYSLPSGSLVSQHMSETRPASIENGLGHPCLGELGGVHVADSDQTVFTGQFRAGDVELMFPCIGDLGVDRSDTFFVPRTLGLGELIFILPVMPESRDFGSVATGGKRLEAEVYADLPAANRKGVTDLALECHVPSPARVLDESASLEYAFKFSGFPEAKTPLEVDNGIAINLDRARDERNPTKSAFGSKAGTEARAAAMRIARCGKLAANSLDRIRMQPEFSGASGAKFDQVECCGPSDGKAGLAAALGFALGSDTKIPDLIAGSGMSVEMFADDGILDAEFEGEDIHLGSVLLLSGPVKSASLGCNPSARSHFVPPHSINNKRVAAARSNSTGGSSNAD